MKSRTKESWDHVLWWGVLISVFSPLLLVFTLSLLADGDAWDQVFYRPTYLALRNSYGVFITQVLLVMPLGLLVGVVSGLFDYPFRRLSLCLSVFPLVLPSFISAIGIQSLSEYLPYDYLRATDGFWGCVWTGVSTSFPLVAVGTFFGVNGLAVSERESALQIGGKKLLLTQTLRRMIPTALAFSCLAGLVSMSDYGVSNIMGFHGVASEIQISFATRFDFILASAKALFILGVSLPLLILIYRLRPRFSMAEIQSHHRQRAVVLSFMSGSGWSIIQLMLCILGSVAMFTGLLRPLLKPLSGRYFSMVWERYMESLDLTLFYGLGSALVSTLLGFFLISYFFTRDYPRRRYCVVVGLVLCYVLPSAITALGMTWIGTQMPAWLDGVFRSEWIVILTLGIRLAPIAALIYVMAYSLLPKGAGELVRMVNPAGWYTKGVLEFWTLRRWALLSVTVTSILALADVGATVLVAPPAGDSFGAYFFGSMDNSPEVLVSSMCMVYMAGPLMIMGGFFILSLLPKLWRVLNKIAKI